MSLLGLVLVFFGVVAVCMGVYELHRHTVIGRNVSASTKEQIEKFSTIDGVCYIVEGLAAILLAFSEAIPFLNGQVGKLLPAIVIFTAMIVNFIMARKCLNSFPSDRKDKEQKDA